MVDKKSPESDTKVEARTRHDSSSSTSSDSSSSTSGSSSGSGSTSSSRSASSSSTASSRSATPKKPPAKERVRSEQRKSRSPRGALVKAERGEKAIVASSRRSPSPERHRRRPSPSPPRRRDRSGSRHRDRRDRSRSKERRSSPVRKATPPPCRLCVRNLSRNVTKDHLSEIFGVYGVLKSCEMPGDRQHSHLGRGYGYIEFEQPEDAEKALKHMDGGQIDGKEVTCELTHPPRSAMNGGGRRPLSPISYRYRGPSPRRYRSPPRGRITGSNVVPLGPSRFNRSRSRSPRRRRSHS